MLHCVRLDLGFLYFLCPSRVFGLRLSKPARGCKTLLGFSHPVHLSFWLGVTHPISNPKAQSSPKPPNPETLQVLSELHAIGLAHRDFKDSNLLVFLGENDAPAVTLVDFSTTAPLGKPISAVFRKCLIFCLVLQKPPSEDSSGLFPPAAVFSWRLKPILGSPGSSVLKFT